jgi:aminomethyltransferase
LKKLELKRTPLYKAHKALGAKFVDFAGWEMPVQYTGVIEEHTSVRSACGVFDVSHMGEIEVLGPGALAALQNFATNDAGRLSDGQCQYTLLCYPDGGVVDDCIVYKFNAERFLVCVNASNTDKVFDWLSSQALAGALVSDISSSYAQIALQGRASVEVLRPLLTVDPAEIKTFRFMVTAVAGTDAIVSRTGYTGEDGFEIYLAPKEAERVWGAILDSGKNFGVKPVGLAARDTLRLEMGYPLYGNELTAKTTPIEAGLFRFVALDRPGFIGKEALEKQVDSGVQRTLVGLTTLEPGIPRQGYEVRHEDNAVGTITSGTLSPMLKKGIALAYVEAAHKEPGTELKVMIRGRAVRARVVKPPFYKKDLFKALN